MSAPILAAVGHGSSAMWYLTRSTGLVALILLTGTVVLGITCSIGWVHERWPRFVSQAVHRNLSLLGLVLIVVHVVSTVADGYVPIGLADALIPFRSPYRPLWVGLGAFAFDLLIAIAITSALRRRIGVRLWRFFHLLAYACWPIALIHGLGSGSDTRLFVIQCVYLLCVVAVVAALGWRLVASPSMTSTLRLGAAVGATFVLLVAALFAFLGPLRPGWSRRAGTSSALLAQLSTPTTANATGGSHPASSSGGGVAVPHGAFQSPLAGSYTISSPDGANQEQLTFSMRLSDGLPLVITLNGQADQGGVVLTAGSVTLGALQGAVTSLNGPRIGATVSGAGVLDNLSIQLNIDRFSHAVSGSLNAEPGAAG